MQVSVSSMRSYTTAEWGFQLLSQKMSGVLISTNDGKTICFRIAKSRGESTLSRKLSQIDDAATEIRAMLRQRRIDF